MNKGILTSGYAPPPMPLGLLGSTQPRASINHRAYDSDAANYIRAVQSADGQELEPAAAKAINDFVVGCKNDGIWQAIRACCILMGARTLAGALVPLVGPAPTNSNFVGGDYSRKTGLRGDGATKTLNSNRAQNAEPQNDMHMAVFVTAVNTTTGFPVFIGIGNSEVGISHIGTYGAPPTDVFVRSQANNLVNVSNSGGPTRLVAVSRNSPSFASAKIGTISTSISQASQSPSSLTSATRVFSNLSISSQTPSLYTNARMSFYSIGRALSLNSLDRRVGDLFDQINDAI